MTYHFRELKENEIIDFLHIRNHVYPAFAGTSQDAEKSTERYKKLFAKDTVTPIGAYSDDEKLLGIMILFDFTLNFRGKAIRTGGIGGVGVDLVYKKRHICRDMIAFGLQRFMDQGIYSSILHPFRVDFYKKMGFGLLTPFYRYCLPTNRIEIHENSKQVTFLNEDGIKDIAECYQSHFERTNGEIKRNAEWPKAMLNNHTNIVIGYRENNKLMAYAICSPFKLSDDNFLRHDLKVHEFITLNTTGRKALLGFLRTQADQFENIRFYTQDDTFYQQFDNPADNTKAIFPHANHTMAYASTGLMFRVLDTKGFVNQLSEEKDNHDKGIVCLFDINEPFLKEQKQDIKLKITENGIYSSKEDADLTIKLSMANFSSMLFGAVAMRKLVNYGLAECSDNTLMKKVSELITKCEKPVYHAEF
ncbi:MAG: GNAT family N-acetyltransferase [Thermotogota bacterium]|nr:GNAT family N-acetyltransferase [Thermotogota bacterium]